MNFPYLKEAVSNFFSRPVPIPFPQPGAEGAKDYRGRISYDPEKCVNCGMCVKVCSPGAITRVFEEAEGGKRITYTFDLTSCTFCGMCQDFCDDHAIRLTADYHMVARDARDLRTEGTRFAPDLEDLYCGETCIYCGICQKTCPQEAITVDRKSKSWAVDLEKCVQCGKCVGKCPKKALSFGKPQEAEEAPAEGEGKEAAGKETAGKEAAGKEAAGKEAVEKETADKKTVEKVAQEKES